MKYSILVKIILIPLFWLGASDLQFSEGFYQFTKLCACLGFCWLSYYEIRQRRALLAILAIAGVILFNPVFPLKISPNDWQNIYVVAIPVLLIWLLIEVIVALVRKA